MNLDDPPSFCSIHFDPSGFKAQILVECFELDPTKGFREAGVAHFVGDQSQARQARRRPIALLATV
jgi:hypothetical protein